MPKEMVYAVVPELNGVTMTLSSLPGEESRQGALVFHGEGKAYYKRLLELMKLQVLINFQQGKDSAAGEEADEEAAPSRVRIFTFLGKRQDSLKMIASIIKHCTACKKELHFEIPGALTYLKNWRYLRYYFSCTPTVIVEITKVRPQEEKMFRFHIYQAIMEYYGTLLAAERVELFRSEFYKVREDEGNGGVIKTALQDDVAEQNHYAEQNQGSEYYRDHDALEEQRLADDEKFDFLGEVVSFDEFEPQAEQEEQTEPAEQAGEPPQQAEEAGPAEHPEQGEDDEQEGFLQQTEPSDQATLSEQLKFTEQTASKQQLKVCGEAVTKGGASRRRKPKRGGGNLQALFSPPDGPLFQFTPSLSAEQQYYPSMPLPEREPMIPFGSACPNDSSDGRNHPAQAQGAFVGMRCVPVERDKMKLLFLELKPHKDG